jgi:hypothetical protein
MKRERERCIGVYRELERDNEREGGSGREREGRGVKGEGDCVSVIKIEGRKEKGREIECGARGSYREGGEER